MAELAMLADRKVVTHPASSLAQDRESSPAETSVLTTVLRRQLVCVPAWRILGVECAITPNDMNIEV